MLNIRNWAKTVAFDYDVEDELYSSNIIGSYPKAAIDVTKQDWRIAAVRDGYSSLKRHYLDFVVITTLQDRKVFIIIRIFSPNTPRISNFNQYIDARVVGVNFLCTTVDEEGNNFHIARFIKTLKSDGSGKSNPILRCAEDEALIIMSYRLSHKPINVISSKVDLTEYQPLLEKEYFELIAPEFDVNKFVQSDGGIDSLSMFEKKDKSAN